MVTRAMDQLGIVHTVGGSIAASFAGEPRSTIDIDIVAAVSEPQIPALVSALAGDFYVDEASLRRAVRDRTGTNLIHDATQIKDGLQAGQQIVLADLSQQLPSTTNGSTSGTFRLPGGGAFPNFGGGGGSR